MDQNQRVWMDMLRVPVSDVLTASALIDGVRLVPIGRVPWHQHSDIGLHSSTLAGGMGVIAIGT